MKKKQIIILCLVLGVLLAGIIFKTFVRGTDPRTVSGPQLEGDPAFRFDTAQVEKILLEHKGKAPPVELAKVNGRWEVKTLWGARADEGKVLRFLEEVRGLHWELRAADKKFFSDFGIDDPEAYSVQLAGTGDAPLLDLRVGTKQAGRSGFFLRKASEDEVFFTETDIAELLGIFSAFADAAPRPDYWADLTLFDIHIDRALSVVIERLSGGKERVPALGVRREAEGEDLSKNAWKFTAAGSPAKAVDPDKVLKLLIALNSVKAQTVVDPHGKDYGLKAPVLEIAVTEKGRGEVRITVGAKDEKADVYFVKSSDRPGIFQLSANDFQDLDRKDEQLVQEAPAAQGPPKAP